MAIDRTGRGGGAGGPRLPPEASPHENRSPEKAAGAPSRPEDVDRTGRAFDVQRGAGARPGGVEGAAPVAGSAPLERLQAGEIDLAAYLDIKVDEATRSLKGLGASELDEVKRMLREQLSTDPALVDLVQQATGASPPARE